MLGLVLSVIVSAAPAPAPSPASASASVTCPEGPASCDADAVAAALAAPGGDEGEAPRRYATPAVIDCRAPTVPTVLQTLVGECDGTPRDASYRASRYPESEESTGSLVPAGRERRPSAASCNGLPRNGGELTVSPIQPVALFAVPDVMLAPGDSPLADGASRPACRTADPLERPPRA
jgi:hypothetical protein